MPSEIILSTEISHRVDFSLLCNARGYVDAVEVGTDLGVFARDFLARWNGHWLFCVDSYETPAATPYDRRGDLAAAIQALAPYHGRFRFLPARSTDAAAWINRLVAPDFVYIDASHNFVDVCEDLAAWWPTLKKTGMLAGHDYDLEHPGVIEAVSEFANTHHATVRLTHELEAPASWYIYKTEPPSLFQKLFTDREITNPSR